MATKLFKDRRFKCKCLLLLPKFILQLSSFLGCLEHLYIFLILPLCLEGTTLHAFPSRALGVSTIMHFEIFRVAENEGENVLFAGHFFYQQLFLLCTANSAYTSARYLKYQNWISSNA